MKRLIIVSLVVIFPLLSSTYAAEKVGSSTGKIVSSKAASPKAIKKSEGTIIKPESTVRGTRPTPPPPPRHHVSDIEIRNATLFTRNFIVHESWCLSALEQIEHRAWQCKILFEVEHRGLRLYQNNTTYQNVNCGSNQQPRTCKVTASPTENHVRIGVTAGGRQELSYLEAERAILAYFPDKYPSNDLNFPLVMIGY